MFTIWGRENCVWCKSAQELLGSRGINYEYIPLTQSNLETFQRKFDGAKTVPQIEYELDPYIYEYIGGYDDLVLYIRDFK